MIVDSRIRHEPEPCRRRVPLMTVSPCAWPRQPTCASWSWPTGSGC